MCVGYAAVCCLRNAGRGLTNEIAAVCYAENGDEKVGGASPAPKNFQRSFGGRYFKI